MKTILWIGSTEVTISNKLYLVVNTKFEKIINERHLTGTELLIHDFRKKELNEGDYTAYVIQVFTSLTDAERYIRTIMPHLAGVVIKEITIDELPNI